MKVGLQASRMAAGALTLAGAGAIALLAFFASQSDTAAAASGNDAEGHSHALIGEARQGSVTVGLAPAVTDIAITDARVAGRPIVVIDPGHGGRDPGATSVSGEQSEKYLTLLLARELRDRLAERGRVRVALTREDDRYLSLEQRAGIARNLGAAVYLSLHIDSAPNPDARGASIYSLSDVASDADAARLARRENDGAVSTAAEGSVRAALSDLALRDQMEASARLAERMVRKASGSVLLRPEPHRFADFHVLRRAAVPAVLFEAGYISNSEDEAKLVEPDYRAKIVSALAQAIEADVASRIVR